MRLTPTDEQRQLADTAARLLAAEYPFKRARRVGDELGGFDREFWARMSEMGWIGACLPEAAGGYAESAEEPLILMRALGRGLVVEPMLAGVIAPARAILAAAPDRAEALLAPLIAGDGPMALAWAEAGRRYDLSPAATRAERAGAGWRLSGRKLAVVAAPQALSIVVSAATPDGDALFLVPRDAPGLSMAEHRMIDGQSAAELVFENVALDADALLGAPGEGLAALEAGFDWGAAGACAMALGSIDAVLDMTLAYARDRRQFDKTLAEFQVVQHRLAAMAVEAEYARSMAPLLAAQMDGEAKARRLAVSACRVKIGAAARLITGEGVQLHGGIGMTDELAVSHHFRKALALDHAFGDQRWHFERYRRGRGAGADLLAA